ncbi:MAG: YybH family protein [Chitinophagaceae bacterium]
MKFIIAFTIFIFSINAIDAQSKNEKEISSMLQKQVIAWNNGDLKNFMVGYWQSDSLLFIGKSGPKYGYTTTLNNYRKSYPDTTAMGKLTSTVISINKISSLYYFVVGKWQLTRSIGNLEGHYTLLIKKINGKWVIVSDHSS